MQTIGKRLPRFRREQEEIRPFKLTPRDLEIIRQVARHRFLSSTQIFSLVEGSATQVLRRLQILYHSGYLDRPRCQIDYFGKGGSRPMVYGLGSRGAGTLRQKFGLPFARMDWDTKNKNAKRVFLEHSLMTAEILVNFELACRRSEGRVRYISAEEIENETVAQGVQREDLHRWRTAYGGKQEMLIPDGLFVLEYANEPAGRNRRLCFIEADRGTMPLARSRSIATSVERKLHLYSKLWKQGQFTRKLPANRVQIFIITESATRTANMLEAFIKLQTGRGLFHFGDVGTLRGAPSALDYAWRHLG